jgi:ribonuclease R
MRRTSGKKKHRQAEKTFKKKKPGAFEEERPWERNQAEKLAESAESDAARMPRSPRDFKRGSGNRDPGDSQPASGGGEGLVLRDRSGKVHVLGKRPGKPAPDSPRQEREFEPRTPTSHAMDYDQGPERVHRGRPGPGPGQGQGQGGGGGQKPSRRGSGSGTFSGGSPGSSGPGGGPRGRGQRPPSRSPRVTGAAGDELIRLKASVDKNRKGFGFLAFEDRKYEDVFVPPREAERMFHGDRVEVTISRGGEVHQVKVLEHRFREMTGRWLPHPSGRKRGGWVVYERKKNREQVLVPNLGAHNPEEGDWVRTRLVFNDEVPEGAEDGGDPYAEGGTSGPPIAEIVEVFGPDLPASADVGMIANEYSLVEEHPAEAEREAREQKLEIPGKDLEGREDLRHVPFITIDGETARDFDDAVYVERAKGGFVLWVAIADVSHYVREGMALDESARSRGTSVYFPERAFHMLPRALSENLCSLRPDEPRLTMVARMEYDKSGKRTHTELMEAVIQSKRRATYNQIQAEWEANGNDPSWEFAPHFALYQIIRRTRMERGSIDFEFPEAELLVEKTGEVISIKNRARMDAHRLIEEFMIGANEAVTEWTMARGWPFVYRVHDVPAMQALEKFQTLAANVGVNFAIGDASPKVMADLVRELEDHPAKDLLSMAMLRSMKQAAYSSAHGIHFGLASQGYTHFTSPIRRYPDLVVHRVLRQALRAEKGLERKPQERELQKLEDDLTDICEHCSYRERLASNAERDANKLKQVRLMMRHLGDEFDGKVNGMTDNGMFIALDDPFVEGMVPKDSMDDDFYQFDDQHMVFFGTRKRRTFRIADRVKVRVARADIDTRTVDFDLLDGGELGAKLPSGRGTRGKPSSNAASGGRGGPGSQSRGRPGSGGGSGAGQSGHGSAKRGRSAIGGASLVKPVVRGPADRFVSEQDRPRKGKRGGFKKRGRRK